MIHDVPRIVARRELFFRLDGFLYCESKRFRPRIRDSGFSSIPRYVIRPADFIDVCNFPKYPVYVIDRSKSEFVGVSSGRRSSTRTNRRLEEIRCAEQAARQQRNVWSAKSCDLEEKPAPMQEVFLPSRWSGAEMKISHLNFFTRRPIRRG